jgi:general secretion pathway protein B
MSIILDALKQSEKERQQQAESVTDTLYIQVEPERRSLWPMALVLLLLLNIGIMLFLWWRSPAGNAPPAPPQSAHEIIENARLAQPEPVNLAAPDDTPAPKTASRILRPLQQELGNTKIVKAPRPTTKPEPTSAEPSPQAVEKTAAKPSAPAANPAVEPREMDDVTLQKLQAYEINTIVYSDTPSRRYALINMQKLKEGAVLPGSKLRIERITTNGLVIDTGDGLVRYSGTP